MPDKPTLPEPTGNQGAAWFLAAYLNSLFLHELGEPGRAARGDPGGAHARAVRARPVLGQAARGQTAAARRTLRVQVADRRAGCRRPTTGTILILAPAALLHPRVPQPDRSLVYALLTGYLEQEPGELVFMAG